MKAMAKIPPTDLPASAIEAAEEAPASTGLVQAVREREAILLELIRAQRTLSLYPEGHPQRAGALAQSYRVISSRLQGSAETDLDVGRRGFSFRDRPVAEGNASLLSFARELHLRQIKQFAFRRDLTLAEFEAFLRLLTMEPAAFRAGDLIENHFRRNQIRGIRVNEIDFGRVKGGGVGGDGAVELEPVEDSAKASDERVEIEDLPEEEPDAVKDRIRELIAALDQEQDPDRFLALTRELEVIAGQLTGEKNYEPAWVILAAVSDHAECEEDHSEVCRAHALRSVRALAQRELLNYLLERYTTIPENRRRPYERVLRQLEMAALEPILVLLGKNEALYSHRRLLDFIAAIGPKMREPLEARLSNSSGYLTRKIVFLLGELRCRESVEALRGLLVHKESRIRKEAVRALAKIKGAESSRALIGGLGQKLDPETKVLIVQTLGELRDLSAVPALLNLLRKRAWLEENYELLSAAASALGQIGSREAVPLLTRTLHHRKWFQTEPNESVRIAAAQALGLIGGESTVKALRRYLGGKDSALEIACEQALAQIEADLKSPGPGGPR
jgi:hypothetical protein